MSLYNEIFPGRKPIIGMIHLPAMPGYQEHQPIEETRRRILTEARVLKNGGVHAIMVENNYDIPHREFVTRAVESEMTDLINSVVHAVQIPIGVDVLWSGFRSALRICKYTGARFVRVASYVDDVKTRYGKMIGRADEAMTYRSRLGLDKRVAVFADVQVKHSEMIDRTKPLRQSVREAVEKGADGIIITGTWTGVAPIMGDLHIARRFGQGLPIIVGSGSTPENMGKLFTSSDAIIVGTAIMTDRVIDKKKLDAYMDAYRSLRVRNFRTNAKL